MMKIRKGGSLLKLLDIFKSPSGVGVSQSVDRQVRHPFSYINGYTPLKKPSHMLYRSLREAVPIIDAAITKTIRLVGGFSFRSSDGVAERLLCDFKENIPTGAGCASLESFICSYLDSLLTFGNAVGEVVENENGDIVAVLNCPLDNLELREEEGFFDAKVYLKKDGGESELLKRQDLILFSALNPEAGELTGTSILKGLPFISDILLKIFTAIGQNWERSGNIRYAVTYNPNTDSFDKSFAKDRARQIASEWAKAMNDNNTVRDFICVGDVSIKAIGADGQILDSSVPVRQLLEQILSKLSIPPFLLGLSWSTTERMSTGQADILTSELESIRRTLNPILLRIAKLYLRSKNRIAPVEIVWSEIDLQDELDLANARLLNARAQQIEETLKKEEQN
jgi:hypothetical protein